MEHIYIKRTKSLHFKRNRPSTLTTISLLSIMQEFALSAAAPDNSRTVHSRSVTIQVYYLVQYRVNIFKWCVRPAWGKPEVYCKLINFNYWDKANCVFIVTMKTKTIYEHFRKGYYNLGYYNRVCRRLVVIIDRLFCWCSDHCEAWTLPRPVRKRLCWFSTVIST